MSDVIRRGNGVALIERFYAIDPVTKAATPADPSTVIFTVKTPDGVTTAYTFGVDSEVTKVSVGVYLCEIPGPLPTGGYFWACDGSGALIAHGEDQFWITASGVLSPDPPHVAQYGPCQPWITGQDILSCAGAGLTDGDAFKADAAADIASTATWELSGRLFDGVCEQTYRPCRDGCACWDYGLLGFGGWWWNGGGYGTGFGPSGFWYNDCGDRCGCGPAGTTIRLAHYPVRDIQEVKVDGDVVPLEQFTLRNRRDLVWLYDETNHRSRFWPACQNLDRPDSDPGTFSVRYTAGAEPPPGGVAAAAALGCELYKAMTGQACALPSKATRIVRQGITIERAIPFADMLRLGATGILPFDMFIASVNPSGARRRPAVFSPDLPGFGVPT